MRGDAARVCAGPRRRGGGF